MADGKKSFVLYADYIQIFEQLTDDEAGRLIKHLFGYVNDKDPVLNDRLLKILFEPIKQQLKRDLKKWEHKREKLSNAGKASANKRQQMSTNVNKAKQKEADPTVTVNATVTVTDNVIERENTAPTHDIKNSNLFKKPNIPTKQQVMEAITNAGGNKEMAKSFYEKHESTGWFINGSAVVNYVTLAQRFVTNWKANEQKDKSKFEPESNAPKLKTLGNGI